MSWFLQLVICSNFLTSLLSGSGSVLKRRGIKQVPLQSLVPISGFQDEDEGETKRPLLKETKQKANSDVLIINTVDGFLHGIGADENGKRNKLWSISSGGPMMSSMRNTESGLVSDYSVLPSVDGTLLVHHNTNGLRKTSVTARMLAEKAPFINEDGLVFSGSKKSRLLGVDVSSGNVFHDSSEDDGCNRLRRLPPGDAGGKEKEKGSGEGVSNPIVSPVWIGRTDYTVRAFDTKTGVEAFNLSYSEIRPLGAVTSSEEDTRALGDGEAEEEGEPRRGNYPQPVISSLEGQVFVADEEAGDDEDGVDRMKISEFSLGEIAVSAFNVATSSSSSSSVAGEDGDDSKAAALSIQMRRVLHRPRPSATNLLDSSAIVVEDVIDTLPSQSTRAKVVRSLIDDGLYAVPLLAYEEQVVEAPEELPSLHVAITDPSNHRRGGSNSIHFPQSALVPIDGSTTSSQLKSTTLLRDRLLEGVYSLLPASDTLYDSVLGEFGSNSNDYHKFINEEAVLPVSPRRSLVFIFASELVRAMETLLVILLVLSLAIYSVVTWFLRAGGRLPKKAEVLLELFQTQLRRFMRALLYGSSDHKLVLRGDGEEDLASGSNKDENEQDHFEGADLKGSQIGSLSLSSDVLGYGSHGTVVFRGSLNSRPVAIKRMLAQFNKAAKRYLSHSVLKVFFVLWNFN